MAFTKKELEELCRFDVLIDASPLICIIEDTLFPELEKQRTEAHGR